MNPVYTTDDLSNDLPLDPIPKIESTLTIPKVEMSSETNIPVEAIPELDLKKILLDNKLLLLIHQVTERNYKDKIGGITPYRLENQFLDRIIEILQKEELIPQEINSLKYPLLYKKTKSLLKGYIPIIRHSITQTSNTSKQIESLDKIIPVINMIMIELNNLNIEELKKKTPNKFKKISRIDREKKNKVRHNSDLNKLNLPSDANSAEIDKKHQELAENKMYERMTDRDYANMIISSSLSRITHHASRLKKSDPTNPLTEDDNNSIKELIKSLEENIESAKILLHEAIEKKEKENPSLYNSENAPIANLINNIYDSILQKNHSSDNAQEMNVAVREKITTFVENHLIINKTLTTEEVIDGISEILGETIMQTFPNKTLNPSDMQQFNNHYNNIKQYLNDNNITIIQKTTLSPAAQNSLDEIRTSLQGISSSEPPEKTINKIQLPSDIIFRENKTPSQIR